jgi:hypothetical protein
MEWAVLNPAFIGYQCPRPDALSRQKANRSQFRRIRKGLIWHFQGSGKSLLMVFAAQKLWLHSKLGNPTVIIMVDRINLDTQITGDITGDLSEQDRDDLAKRAAKWPCWGKTWSRPRRGATQDRAFSDEG